ncbi:MAG: TRAP transporter large permease [Lachnospiraceae bacterium]|nr:TRAP transporter large permease [Lachnospiraceae bacterium]
MSAWLLVLLFVLMFAGIPIAVSLAVTSTIFLELTTHISLVILPQRLFTTVDSFPLMAVPFFVLAGALMEAGGISDRLVSFIESMLGHVTGGLTIVVIVTSAFFAAISGSSSATIAAIGGILIPAMIAQGYNRNYASAVQCCSGQLGVIIPPSIPMVLYGVATETSIGDLFKAGILPGIFMALCLILLSFLICHKKGYKGVQRRSWGQRWKAFKKALLALLMPVLVLGGIYGGLFTPTEAAAVAVAYAFLIGKFVYKKLDGKTLMKALTESAATTAILMFLIACAGVFAWLLGRLNITRDVALFFTSISDNKYVFLLLVNLLLLVAGMFMDAGPAIMILAPLLAPIATQYDVNLVHFGIIMVVNLAVGLCTPPVGVNLFLSCQIGKITMTDILGSVWPYLFVLFVVVLLVTFVPALSLALL